MGVGVGVGVGDEVVGVGVGVGVGVLVGVGVGKPVDTVNVGFALVDGAADEVVGGGAKLVVAVVGCSPLASIICSVAIGRLGLPARYVSMNSAQVLPGRSEPYSGDPYELKIGLEYPVPTHTAVLTCGV